MPVFNAGRFLRRSVSGVLSQSMGDLELICVNDGSTDDSGAILGEFAAVDPRVRVMTQPNRGQGIARNRGMEAATGEYLYFMDADDDLAGVDAFARLLREMEACRLEVVLFDAETKVDADVGEAAKVVKAQDYIRTKDYSGIAAGPQMMARMVRDRAFTVSPCLMLLRRDFVEKNGLRFPAANLFYEDNIFMTHVMLAAMRVSHRPWRLFVRWVHGGSTVTSRPTLRHLLGYLACYIDTRDVMARNRWDADVRFALRERLAGYKLSLRRMMADQPELVAESQTAMGENEQRAFLEVSAYPLGEKIENGWRCLRENGFWYTVRRILFGRQG